MSDFRYRAACRDADPELFFPVGESGPALRQIATAKAVCSRCPVTEDCLAWALQAGHEQGVWGGQDAAERRDLRRRARIVDARTSASGSSTPAPGGRPRTTASTPTASR